MSGRRRTAVGVWVAIVGLLSAACAGSVEPLSADATAADAVPTSAPVVRPTEVDAAAAVPTPTVVPGHGRGQRSVLQPDLGSVADVDFFNYTYDVELYGALTVVDGEVEQGERGDENYILFLALDVDYGDLDGDDIDEAVVTTAYNTGGSGTFSGVTVFGTVDGSVQERGNHRFGDRADGGIFDVEIVDGYVKVDSFSTNQGACCPTFVTENRLVLGETLLVAETLPTRTWIAPSNFDEQQELKFVPGTSSAVVVMYGSEPSASLLVDAATDQQLSFAVTDGPRPIEFTMTEAETGDMVVRVDGPRGIESGGGRLPSDGLYEVSILFGELERSQRSTFVLAIAGESAERETSWAPVFYELVLDDDPNVVASVAYPRLVSAAAGADRANEQIAAHAQGLANEWRDEILEYEDPQGDSSFEMTYEVTLVSDTLFAVNYRFYDYVCCRPYPNYGQRSLVVNLEDGTPVPVAQILDLSRYDEIVDIWLGELIEQSDFAADVSDLLRRTDARIDSLTLAPGGVQIGTDRGSLLGGFPGTTTYLSYALLGDLVLAGVGKLVAGASAPH